MSALFGDFSPLLILAMIFGLVEFFKKLGVQGNASMIMSMALGVALGVLFQVAELYPQINVWFQIGVFGVLFGLAASGFYDFANKRWPQINRLTTTSSSWAQRLDDQQAG